MTLGQIMALYDMDPVIHANKPKKEKGTMEDLMLLAQMPLVG